MKIIRKKEFFNGVNFKQSLSYKMVRVLTLSNADFITEMACQLKM